MTATTPFPTPDNSVIGQTRKVPDEFDEEHVTKRQRIDNAITPAQDKSVRELESLHVASCPKDAESEAFDRQQLGAGRSVFHPVTQSVKAADETTQPAAVEISLEQLQKNVGEVFHLCKSGKNPLLLWQ